ncbi:MAG: hypothetical protein JRN12_06330 [Nitrososphaerota archaeon]|jgi:flagellin-like protein|nr:hypothetical protein [Nitrososphaerota archaeon]
MKISGQRRKAISPIVATVLIIAATLIAFAAVLGYIFGIFGSAASTANISATVTAAVHGPAGTSGIDQTAAAGGNITLALSNSGTGSTTVSSYSITFGGNTQTGSPATGTTLTITPSGKAGSAASANPLSVYIHIGTATTAGESFTGSITLANSEVVTFSGTFA